jgi:hypothetical protein
MKNNEKRLRIAVIAGASHALRYLEKNPRATTNEVVKHVSDNVNGIIGDMEKSEEEF